MTPALGLEYVKRRMRELGYGNRYHMQFRHFVLQPGETLKVKGYNSYYMLVEEPVQVNIRSQNGIFDLSITTASELKYEHHGLIQIRNTGETITRVRFIQAIPYKQLT